MGIDKASRISFELTRTDLGVHFPNDFSTNGLNSPFDSDKEYKSFLIIRQFALNNQTVFLDEDNCRSACPYDPTNLQYFVHNATHNNESCFNTSCPISTTKTGLFVKILHSCSNCTDNASIEKMSAVKSSFEERLT